MNSRTAISASKLVDIDKRIEMTVEKTANE
jgi:hypothetical protein